jgi:hypothetical protein
MIFGYGSLIDLILACKILQPLTAQDETSTGTEKQIQDIQKDDS